MRNNYDSGGASSGKNHANKQMWPLDTIGERNTRTILRASRGLLSHLVKRELQRLDTLTDNRDTEAMLFTSYPDGVKQDTLVIRSDFTAIINNKVRPTCEYEPGYPDGLTLELEDTILPSKKGKKFNHASEVMYINNEPNMYTVPSRATALHIDGNTVTLAGRGWAQEQPGIIAPKPDKTIEDLSSTTDNLWKAYKTLLCCNQVSLDRYVKFEIP